MRSLAGQDTKKLGRPKGTFKVPEQKVLKLIEENSIIRDYSERFHESKNCLTMSKRQLSEVGDVPRESLRRRLRGKNCFKCKLRDGLCDYNGQVHLLTRDAQTDFIKKKDDLVALSDFAEPRTTEYYCVYIYIYNTTVYIYILV